MVGKSLSHYKIEAELGRGGMGIVYRAEDTKLDRTVAIKVLPSAALASEDDRARFYREAKAAAQLHHPHIASVFEIDEAVPEGSNNDDLRPFIAMEFIEGETLHDRIQKGPLKLEEAVRIASEIASALEAAHEKSIVHRDIKAANVMLTSKGSAKVLDFGLAQTAASTKLTRMGSTLGTVAYMSPEQARGEAVDLRTDLWSLGAVLYEMIAGRSPFPGDYEQAVVYEILNQDPEPLTAVRTGVPMGLEWIVSKCLAKKAEDRYQTSTDLLVDLRNVDLATSGMSRMSGTISGPGVAFPREDIAAGKPKVSILEAAKTAWPVVVVAVVTTLGLGYLAFSGGASHPSPARLEKLPIYLDGYINVSNPAVSPTSEYLAFSAEDTLGYRGLFLFHVQSATISPIVNSEGGRLPRFSPDGTQLAFSVGVTAYVVTVPTGVPRALSRSALVLGWSSPTSVLYFDTKRRGTVRFDLDTEAISTVAAPDTSSDDPYGYWINDVVPHANLGIGSRALAGGADPSMLMVDLDSGVIEVGEEGIIGPRYVQGGFLVYRLIGNDGPVVVRPFDAESREFRGPPEDLLTTIYFLGHSVGADGSYVYAPEMLGKAALQNQLFFYDLANNSVEVADWTGDGSPVWPAYSPNGKSVALTIQSGPFAPLYVSEYDLETGLFRRRTFGDVREDPDWSPDGSFLYFDGWSSSSPGIYRQAVDVSGEQVRVIEGRAESPNLSPDGNWLAFSRDTDIFLYNIQSGTETVADSSDGSQNHPDFSPDSRYLAFQTEASGGWDVAIRPVTGTAYIPIGYPRARRPKWAPDGKSLYFLVIGDGIYRVPVTTEPSFDIRGEAQKVVDVRGHFANVWFDISPDGNTLVITATSIGVDRQGERKNYSTLMWWRNWAQSLEKD